MSDGIVFVAPSELREAEDNPRIIRDERFERLCYTLDARPELLEARPLIEDAQTGEIVCGNMRLRAALALLERGEGGRLAGYVEEHGGVPVYRKTFDSPAERREWLTLDNQGFGEWVPAELAALIQAHADDGADLALLGFSEPEVDGLLALIREPAPGGLPDADPDAVSAPPTAPTTQLGDVWLLGEHRLACADAAKPESYERLLDGEPVGAIWTDPPYGVAYDAEARVLTVFGADRDAKPFGVIAGDNLTDGDLYADWLTACLRAATTALIPGGAVYVCHADAMVEFVARAWRQADLHLAQQLLWLKSRLVFGRADYHYMHEPILYGWKEGGAHRWFGDRTQTTVCEVASDHYGAGEEGGYVHPNQKPYDLIRPHLENSTTLGDIVLDPFGGSGSTLIVCEQTGRRARLLEIDRGYCDVIVRRWEAFTGRDAELA